MTTLTARSRFFTEEHEIFREQVRSFVNKEISPYIDQWEHDGLFPKALYKRMGELGFLGIRYPEQYGGSNGDIWMTIAFCEELCRCRALGLPMSVLVHTDMSSTHIARYGSEEQRQKYLPKLATGEWVGCFALTEPEMLDRVSVGQRVLLDDGRLQLTIRQVQADQLHLQVEVGGVLHPNKGVNLPDTRLAVPAITPRDREALAVAADIGVDWLALSFVRAPYAADELRACARAFGLSVPIMAKIERPEALQCAKELIEVFDGINRLEHLDCILRVELDFLFWAHTQTCLFRLDLGFMQERCDLFERLDRTRDLDVPVLLHDVVRAGLDPQLKGFVEIQRAGGEREIGDPVELPADRARLGHIATRLGESVPQVGDRPVAVIGDRLHHHRHAMRGIPFIHDLLEGSGIFIFPGAAPDRSLDIVLRHILGASLIHRKP